MASLPPLAVSAAALETKAHRNEADAEPNATAVPSEAVAVSDIVLGSAEQTAPRPPPMHPTRHASPHSITLSRPQLGVGYQRRTTLERPLELPSPLPHSDPAFAVRVSEHAGIATGRGDGTPIVGSAAAAILHSITRMSSMRHAFNEAISAPPAEKSPLSAPDIRLPLGSSALTALLGSAPPGAGANMTGFPAPAQRTRAPTALGEGEGVEQHVRRARTETMATAAGKRPGVGVRTRLDTIHAASRSGDGPAPVSAAAAGGSDATAAAGATAASPTVDAHVAQRSRARAPRRDLTCRGQLCFLLSSYLITWQLLLLVTLVGLGVLLQFAFPTASFWENAAWRWMYFIASTGGALYPLSFLEWAVFAVVESLRGMSRLTRELVDFADSARGYPRYIAVVVMALLLKGIIFRLSFSEEGEFYFNRTCASLLVIICGQIGKAWLLQVVLRQLYQIKHAKGVGDVLFYAESVLNLSAPLPKVRTSAASEDGDEDSATAMRRTLPPTLVLDTHNFWAQAQFVVDGSFNMYDVDATGEVYVCTTDSSEGVEELANLAYDRLLTYRAERLRAAQRRGSSSGPSKHRSRVVMGLSPLPAVGSFIARALGHGTQSQSEPADATPTIRPTTSASAAVAKPCVEDAAVSEVPIDAPTVTNLDAPYAADASWLTLDDLRACFLDASDLGAACKLLDLDGDAHISRDEFVTGCKLMFAAWQSTRTSLSSYGGISNAIAMMAAMIHWFSIFLILLAIFGVNFNNVIVPLGTIIIALGFAVGPMIQRFIDSLMFVLVIAPFETGDRVAIPGVAGGATLLVEQINVLTTLFIDGAGKRIVARNVELTAQPITNLRRSTEASFSDKYIVDGRVTGAQIRAVQERVTAYVRSKPLEWKPSVGVSISTPGEANTLELSISVTAHASWMEGSKVGPAHTALIIEVLDFMRLAGVTYMQPPLMVHTNSTRAFAMAPGAAEAADSDGELQTCADDSPRSDSRLLMHQNGTSALRQRKPGSG